MKAKLEELVDLIDRFYMLLSNTEAFAPHNILSSKENKVLGFITRISQCNMTNLAINLKLAPSTVTGIIDRLIKKGLVIREYTKQDRRKIFLQITESGRKMLEQQKMAAIEIISKLLDNLSLDEQGQFFALLRKMLQVNSEQVGHIPS